MRDRLRFLLSRLRERLWIKPLAACLLSVTGVLLAHLADRSFVDGPVPDVSQDSVVQLLKITAASMLGIATFAVASMVSAYASAGQMATARAFPLIVADDVSQNALSTFIGAFIFSVIGISAAMNDYYGRAGRFTLFVLMVLVLVIVVLTFVRWVDRIARLGRVGAIVAKVEHAAAAALARRRQAPWLGGTESRGPPCGSPVYPDKVGYVQHIDVAHLQKQAEKFDVRVRVDVLPGAFVSPAGPLCHLEAGPDRDGQPDNNGFAEAFTIGPQRQFDDDPRFGLLALSEIACRALSPGINDPGTAIGVLGSLHRLLAEMAGGEPAAQPAYERVAVPALPLDDLFDDAFYAIARDGAGTVEVMMRLQRHLGDLGKYDARMKACARRQAGLALARAEQALHFPPDLAQIRARHADYWSRA
ncbi:hypothetical protein SRABI118_03261 [Massilia sp. Bi118]|uniref:DUF2254 domain-containing protein n=1 Tax=Massilia sp. Bi118 TaxID=2822346 RepID=UPI001DA24C35|nr:DUF2254 domain-containing protein [Massilia sp. Bi118]CAH0262553.1 hypothetical protein SRABI118_03261 [Massilia sp. Bi118]